MNHNIWESGDWWLDTAINLIVTATAYCSIPIIYRFLIRKKPMVRNNAIPLCILWSFIVCMAFTIIQYSASDPSRINYFPAFLYGAINIAILTKGKDRTVQRDMTFCSSGLSTSNVNDIAQNDAIKSGGSNTGVQLAVNKHIKIGSLTITKQPSKEPKSARSIMLGIICLILIGGSVYLFYQNQQLKTALNDTEASYNDLSSSYLDITKYKGISEYYLNNAVIVKDGDKYYHRLDCPNLGSEYKYQIHNKEAAKGMGFKKCPHCFGMDATEYADKELESYKSDHLYPIY